MAIYTQAESTNWHFPQKRGRGRPRTTVDVGKVVSLCEQGQTYQQIALSCKVSIPIVKRRMRELMQEGRIEPGKLHLYASSREKRARKTEKIIIMYNQMATYEQIGKMLGVTRERVRQYVTRAIAEKGLVIFEERENFIGLVEAKDRLSIRAPLALLEKAFTNGEIPGIQNIYSRKIYVDCRYWEMGEQWAQNTQSRQCVVCDKAFIITRDSNHRRISCSKQCSDVRSAQTSLNHNPKQFRGWRKKVATKLADYHITDQEDWLGAFQAIRYTGLTYMKLRYLAKCKIIATRDHPSKRWGGKPTLTFSRGQLDVVKEVYQQSTTIQPSKMKGDENARVLGGQ